MRVARIVSKVVGPCLVDIDRRIVRTLLSVVETALRIKRLSLTCLGRGLRSRAKPKHSIKRVDRLLGNRFLWTATDRIYDGISATLVKQTTRFVILIDWTDSECDGFVVLSASIASCGGRAVVIRNEVYPLRLLHSGRVECRFLRRLHAQLPLHSQVTVITDAGFHIPFFRTVCRLGWDFVGRISRNVLVGSCAGGAMARVDKALFPVARAKPQSMGPCYVTSSHRYLADVVVVKKKKEGRHGTKRDTRKVHQGSPAFEKCRARGNEPWVLVTSLKSAKPDLVTRLYGLRMQIEQCFRDSKNQRFGLAFQNVRCRNAQRIAVLLVIAALVSLLAIITGTAAERAKIHRAFQANTVTRRVLSRFLLGILLLARERRYLPTLREIRCALEHLRRELVSHFAG
jgi:hypothetical protein